MVTEGGLTFLTVTLLCTAVSSKVVGSDKKAQKCTRQPQDVLRVTVRSRLLDLLILEKSEKTSQ